MRNWRCYSLRALLISVAGLCALLGSWRHEQDARYGAQREFLEAVESLGGTCGGSPVSSVWSIGKDEPLLRLSVELAYCRVNDADLLALSQMKGASDVIELNLNYTQITDSGLPYLKGFRQLFTVHLSHCAVTDNGLLALEQVPSLKSCDLGRTKITRMGAWQLKQRRPDLGVATSLGGRR